MINNDDKNILSNKIDKPKRIRKPKPQNLADFIRKHSPIKAGLQVKDEDSPLTKYNKITDKIYLGNIQSANDKSFFKEKNIKAVLNCTRDIPNHFAHKNIEYMRIPVDDSLKQKDFDYMYQFMPCIVEFIHKHTILQKNNILVHCYAGRQRSAISVAAFLVSHLNMTPHDACKMILEKRPEAFHFGYSLNFDQALNKFYKDVQKKRR